MAAAACSGAARALQEAGESWGLRLSCSVCTCTVFLVTDSCSMPLYQIRGLTIGAAHTCSMLVLYISI